MALSDIINLEKMKQTAFDPREGERAFGESFNKALFGEIDRRRKLKETEAAQEFQIKKLEAMFGAKQRLQTQAEEFKKKHPPKTGGAGGGEDENINKALGTLQAGFQVISGKKLTIKTREDAEGVARSLYKSSTGVIPEILQTEMNRYPTKLEWNAEREARIKAKQGLGGSWGYTTRNEAEKEVDKNAKEITPYLMSKSRSKQTQTKGGTKKTSEQRFNELTGEGKSEDEAYKILATEGY
jgi:hypothetical protein